MNPLDRTFHDSGVALEHIDGVAAPAVFDSVEAEVAAIRGSVALSAMNHVSMTAIDGEDALGFIDRICPRFLHINPNRMKQTVFINEKGDYLCDAYVCRDKDGCLLLCRGIESDAFVSWLLSHKRPLDNITIRNLNQTHSLLAVNGPFSWELMADMHDPEIIGLPYLSFYHPSEDVTVFRAGETGEYGYLVCVPHDRVADSWEQLLAEGKRYDMARAGLHALEYCMLENNFFNIRKEGACRDTPAELQIQWRVSYHKAFLFADRLKAMREKPLARRITGVYSECTLVEGMPVFGEGDARVIGTIVNARRFLSGPGHIGLAMIDMPYAVSGIDFYRVNDGENEAPLLTVSPPFVNNRSLYVDPQVHAYGDRNSIVFPPVCGIRRLLRNAP